MQTYRVAVQKAKDYAWPRSARDLDRSNSVWLKCVNDMRKQMKIVRAHMETVTTIYECFADVAHDMKEVVNDSGARIEDCLQYLQQ
eukprot:4494135-Pyramimonas_sp.AAC.1